MANESKQSRRLSPEDYSEIHGPGFTVDLKPEEKARRLKGLRAKYEGCLVALQQIDIVDKDSPYRQKMVEFREAVEARDKQRMLELREWFDAHYSDVQ